MELQIAAYDPGWVQAYDAERRRLTTALGDVARRIDHHGSTAVPGLDAKPVIDIQVSVRALQPLVVYGDRLAGVGYVHVPHADDAVCPFFHRPRDWPHAYHVHVVQAGGLEERRTLAFRDFLREHDETACEYAALKRRLAATSDAVDARSRERYAMAKSDFVERIVAAALAAGYPRHFPD